MDPNTKPTLDVKKRGKQNQFTPKWRHFDVQSTVYLRNPFKEDIVFQVADEHNTPYHYKLPAGQLCELPGGAIATLGVKEVVDRLIGENPDDAIRIWEKSVRKKYENQVIERIKEAPKREASNPTGPIDLGSGQDQVSEEATADKPEEAFPGLDKGPTAPPANPNPAPINPPVGPAQPPAPPVDPNEEANRQAVGNIAASSLGDQDQVLDEE